ncbi:MAG: magnesium transporter [Burkholderiaceae bacterium]
MTVPPHHEPKSPGNRPAESAHDGDDIATKVAPDAEHDSPARQDARSQDRPGEESRSTRGDDIDASDQIRHALETEDADALVRIIDELSVSEALRELSHLPDETRDAALASLPVEMAASLVEEAPIELASTLLESLEISKAADIVDELHSDTRADVIAELDQDRAEAILAELDASEAAEVRRMAAYDPETAGGLMIVEVLTCRDTDQVGSFFRRLASDEEGFERYQRHHPYIVDGGNRLVGVVSLPEMLSTRRSAPLSEIMTTPLRVGVEATLDELQDFFEKHSFPAVPVTDEENRLLGVVSRETVAYAAQDRAETEALRLQGVFGDELRTMPTTVRAKRRLAWLSANIGLNILAASVISMYEETLAAVIAIAVFLPMVSDMSGCSGNQAVGVTMRELSLGLVKPVDAMWVWLKEVTVGSINGVALGVLIGLVAWIWKGNPYLGVVIGVALALNTIVAVSIGGVVPLLLKKLGQDPAVASGPLLTTITDMAGFFFVLSIATAMMPLLK